MLNPSYMMANLSAAPLHVWYVHASVLYHRIRMTTRACVHQERALLHQQA